MKASSGKRNRMKKSINKNDMVGDPLLVEYMMGRIRSKRSGGRILVAQLLLGELLNIFEQGTFIITKRDWTTIHSMNPLENRG